MYVRLPRDRLRLTEMGEEVPLRGTFRTARNASDSWNVNAYRHLATTKQSNMKLLHGIQSAPQSLIVYVFSHGVADNHGDSYL